MPVANALSKKAKAIKRAIRSRDCESRRTTRQAAPWLPNVAGTRFVRDESQAGITSKRVSR